MPLSGTIFKLKGKIQHYAWGGSEFIPDLLGQPNPRHQPFAEYWMGAHPSASSLLEAGGHDLPLIDVIKQYPAATLSEKTAGQFSELPYLLKVLDVKDMLSIQVHPSKEHAEKGFEEENAAGVPMDAPYRNYKDRNHKPEVMVALSPFWLLHGFRSKATLEKMLDEIPEFSVLLPLFRKEGYRSLYQFIMEMPQQDINMLFMNLVKRELRRKQDGELSRDQPGWWVAKLFGNKDGIGDIDRGIFSIYLLNIVALQPGEAIFQSAGIPHAYLEGQNIELMANSDNVLRGGLTPKHTDVPELMKHITFEETAPALIKGQNGLTGETVYPCPVNDFGISRIVLDGSLSYEHISASLEILIVMEGGALVNNRLVLKRGESFTVFANTVYTIRSSGHCVLFRAFVPVS